MAKGKIDKQINNDPQNTATGTHTKPGMNSTL
jgi:hypothetical protein